jgi:peroxiredoxin Q/BCP
MPLRPVVYAADMLEKGDPAPDFNLPDQHGNPVSLSGLRGKTVVLYFYPKADTPGCTTQACGLRDIAGQIGHTVVLGLSPDKPAKLAKFDEKYSLGFDLLSDPEHATAEAYDVWKEKKNYGKTYMGIERSAFLVGPDGKLRNVWYKVSPKDTPLNLLAALES